MAFKDKEKQKASWRKHYANHSHKYKKRAKDKKALLKKWLQEYKATLMCCKCGEAHPACLDFHHKDASLKLACIATLVNSGSKTKLIKEIAKCEVLCANCHRKLHYRAIV